MSRELMRLPRTNFSGLDWDNIIQDITNLVQDNPTYSTAWDDFLSSDAGRMLVELFAYIADQLATRIDWIANENFIGTATLKSSVIRILKLIGYNFTLPISASVNTTTTVNDWTPISNEGDIGFYLTVGYENGDTGWEPFSITATGKDGTIKTFELLDVNTATGIPNYSTSIYVLSISETKTFHEGRTVIDTFEAETDNNPIFTLTRPSVIEDSVLVRLIGDTGGLTTETDLLQVGSFLDQDAQRDTDDSGDPIAIPYVFHVEEDDTVSIEFGPTSLLPLASRRLSTGDRIRVIYRIGGGVQGNIVKNAINTTKNILVPLYNSPSTSVTLSVSFVNSNAATGGTMGETAEHAAVYAPLVIRTVEKAVTSEDYKILLEAHSNVIVAKSYGGYNMPSDLYDLHGLYIRPFEVWNYIVPKTSGWNDLGSSEYKDFYWMAYRNENRFNGIYNFTSGKFNYEINISTDDIRHGDSFIDWFGDTDYTFYQDVGLSFYDGDSDSGLTDGDSYYFDISGNSYNIVIVSGDSTWFWHIVDLMNAEINGDSYYAEIVGDTEEMDIRVTNMVGDSLFNIELQHPSSGDTLWVNLNTWSVDFNDVTSSNYGDTFYNFIVLDTSQYFKTALQDVLNGDTFFRAKISYTEDATQQFRNIANLVVGDSLYGDTERDTTWQIERNINAYLQGSEDCEVGIDMSTNYLLEISLDGDTYISINLRNSSIDHTHVRAYEIMHDINYAFFINPSYGDTGNGDTSYGDSTGLSGVASVIEATGGYEYIRLESPKSGDSSSISIRRLSEYDISDKVFGDFLAGDTGDEIISYGKKRFTIITKDDSTDFGKIIFETGTANILDEENNLFVHFLDDSTDSIIIGDYFYNLGESDIKYRPKSTRIYNSYFSTDGDSTVNVELSDFQLKFTKEEVETKSLWAIGDSWDLNYASSPTITGDTKLGDSVLILSDRQYLKVNVDGKGDTALDCLSGGDTGWHEIGDIIDNLNDELQSFYVAEGTTYSSAIYFSIEDDYIVFTGPTITNDSYVKVMSSSGDSLAEYLFGSSVIGDSITANITGDYYLEYDSTENMMKITKTNDSDIPDLDFYCHFINDQSYYPDPTTSIGEKVFEDVFDTYLSDKKIIGIENVFKETKFSTFDIVGTIHYDSSFSVGQIRSLVNSALQEEFYLVDSNGYNKRYHGQKVYKSKVMDIIHSISGIEYVEISYFGKDATDLTTNQDDYIDCDFDEIICLSESVFVQNAQVHGILFTYRIMTG